MTKPILLVDVDGVLCPFGFGVAWRSYTDWSPDGEGWRFCEPHGVFWTPKTKDRLERLSEHFHVHWGTGWQHHANEIISPLHGLPTYPVMEIGWAKIGELDDFLGRHWKLTSIIDHVKGEPFAFIDDEICDHDIAWADERSRTVAPTLFVPTHPNIGMTDEHVQQLQAWAEGITP